MELDNSLNNIIERTERNEVREGRLNVSEYERSEICSYKVTNGGVKRTERTEKNKTNEEVKKNEILEEIIKQNIESTDIKHIVLSGGAYLGLYEFGALKYLHENKYFNLDNIETIHGTSIGGLLGAILCTKPSFNHIYDYFINRPWYKMMQINPSMFFDVIPNKGLLGKDFFISMLKPILNSADINIDITLREFYELTNIELFLYSVNLNKYTLEQLSYKTNPDLELLDAIHMTCALPYIFQPIWYNNSFYIDGSLINNYPIEYCILNKEINTKSILGIKLDTHNKETEIKIHQNMNIFEYGYFLYRKMVQQKKENNSIYIENEIVIPCGSVNMNEGYKVVMESSKRKELITDGEKFAYVFLQYKNTK